MKKLLHSFRKYAALLEDSRSSIMDTFGFDANIADGAIEFTKGEGLDERHAFLIFKVLYLSTLHHYANMGRSEKLAKQMARNELARFNNEEMQFVLQTTWKPDPMSMNTDVMPLGTLDVIASEHRDLLRGLRSAKTFADAQKVAVQYVIDERRADENALIRFPDGYYWAVAFDCKAEGISMQHCGEAEDVMISLRSKDGKSHVTVDWSDDVHIVWAIKGRQNTIPIKKYWKYIFAFIDEMNVRRIEEVYTLDGEDDVRDEGTLLPGEREKAHDASVNEFFEAIVKNTKLEPGVLSGVRYRSIPAVQQLAKIMNVVDVHRYEFAKNPTNIRVAGYVDGGLGEEEFMEKVRKIMEDTSESIPNVLMGNAYGSNEFNPTERGLEAIILLWARERSTS